MPNSVKSPGVDQPKRQRLVFLRNRKSLIGLGILGFFTLVAIFGEWLAPFSPDDLDPAAAMAGPSSARC